ncbi:MAG: hypothetical protein COA79_14290 [Planctomycetota bacterium]|nr:MAG: hypothetical protein COA79_14290 [Planctomycetota bacterium]
MKISAKLDYALRLLVNLADSKDQYIPTSEIANKEDMSLKFLQSIVKTLKNAGVIEAMNGPHGGIKFAKSPKDITFLQIYEIFHEDLRVVEPCKELITCSHINACGIQNIIYEGQMKMREYFQSITLEYLAQQNAQVISIHESI